MMLSCDLLLLHAASPVLVLEAPVGALYSDPLLGYYFQRVVIIVSRPPAVGTAVL